MTGRNCEIDIDDCESQPCLHNGICQDGLNAFVCNCNGTGFTGSICQENIDECLSNPCIHGSTCVDKINDYHCVCHTGYDGKNCENDINECEPNPCEYSSMCLEKSNQSLYMLPVQDRQLLPPIFSKKFSYENVSGYECLCVLGTKGKNCEISKWNISSEFLIYI